MPFPNEPFIMSGEAGVSIGNAHIVRTFTVSANKKIRTSYIRNRRIPGELDLTFQPCSEEFILRILTGRKKTAVLKASMLTVADMLVREDGDVKQFEVRFAPLHALGVSYTVTMVVEVPGDKPFLYKYLRIATTDANVKIDSIDTEYISLPRGLKQSWSRPDMKKAYLSPFQSALGQPVYLNGMYTGSEFPANDNNIEAGIAHVRYYSGKTFHAMASGAQEYVTWKTVFGAARGLEQEVIQADFLSYIQGISQPIDLRTQYNSWFDHMLEIDKDNIRDSFFEIEKGLTQNGVPPVDSYVVDDGWPDYDKDFWCFNSKFPNELYESARLAKNFASDFGLWLGPRGGYNAKTPKFARHMQRAGKGGYNRRGNDVCTADHRYHKNLTALFLDYMERFDINYWKLDGFMLKSCPSKKHGHPTGGYEDMYAFTDHWENWIRIFKTMHAARAAVGKTLWLNQTSYCNASPWHLQFCESLWMQNSNDIDFIDKTTSGEAMHGADFDRMLTYRDARYFDFCETRSYQFPLSNLYNHEPIYGNTAKIQMTDDEFRQYMYMIATRGTAFWELYYSYNMFNAEKWQINADVLRFIRENFHILRHAKRFGASPETGAVYGYSAWEGAEGIVSVRNPLNRPQSFSFTLDRCMGVKEDARDMHCVMILPYTTSALPNTRNYGDILSVDLQPHEIRIFRFGAPQTDAPVLLRARVVDQNTAVLSFNKRIALPENACLQNGEALSATLMADYSSMKVTFAHALESGEQVTLAVSVQDVYGNVCAQPCELTYYADGKLPGAFTGDNDFTLRMQLTNAPKDGVLLTLGRALVVSVSNGCLVAECKGVKAKSDAVVHDRASVRADVVRERNGTLKIYVDGVLSGAGYDKNRVCPAIESAQLQAGEVVQAYTFYDHALSFDALK